MDFWYKFCITEIDYVQEQKIAIKTILKYYDLPFGDILRMNFKSEFWVVWIASVLNCVAIGTEKVIAKNFVYYLNYRFKIGEELNLSKQLL